MYRLFGNIKIKKAQNADPLEIAQLYREAAKLSEELGEYVHAVENLADANKYEAYHHLDNENYDGFFKCINECIRLNEEADNVDGRFHALGTKYIESKQH